MERLRRELTGLLHDVLRGNFLATRVPEDARRLNDIALSGNGEPTSAREFDKVIELIGVVRREAAVPDAVKTVLITNGSLMQRATVQRGVEMLAGLNGEVWFKLDRATETGIRAVNNTRTSMARVRSSLASVARLCPTWIQTCLFAVDGATIDESESRAYVEFLRSCVSAGIVLQGVLLYSLARKSFQPEASRLSRLSPEQLEQFAGPVRALGLAVKLTP